MSAKYQIVVNGITVGCDTPEEAIALCRVIRARASSPPSPPSIEEVLPASASSEGSGADAPVAPVRVGTPAERSGSRPSFGDLPIRWEDGTSRSRGRDWSAYPRLREALEAQLDEDRSLDLLAHVSRADDAWGEYHVWIVRAGSRFVAQYGIRARGADQISLSNGIFSECAIEVLSRVQRRDVEALTSQVLDAIAQDANPRDPRDMVASLLASGVVRVEEDDVAWLSVAVPDGMFPADERRSDPDREYLPFHAICALYVMHRLGASMGVVAWCVARRRTMPVPDLAVTLSNLGYDVDALVHEEFPPAIQRWIRDRYRSSAAADVTSDPPGSDGSSSFGAAPASSGTSPSSTPAAPSDDDANPRDEEISPRLPSWLPAILADVDRRAAERPEWAKSEYAREEIARLREGALRCAPEAKPSVAPSSVAPSSGTTDGARAPDRDPSS